MSILDRLLGREERAISPATLFGTGADTLGVTSDAGVRVDTETAFSLIAFWACVRLLAADISTLPGKAYRELDDSRQPLRPQPRWISMPDGFDPSITRIDHFSQVAVSLLTDGNAFTLCLPSVIEPEVLTVLNPRFVEVKKPGRSPEYHVRGRTSTASVLGPDTVLHTAIFRRPGELRGMNPVRAAEEGIGLGVATQRYSARMFGQGMTIPGFIEVPGEAPQPAIDQMAADLQKRHGGWRKAGLMGFLTAGAKYNPTGLTPKDADLGVMSERITEEMARLFGIPPHMIGSQKPGAVAYASVEHRSIEYVTHTLRHYVEPIEASYSRLVPGDNRLSAAGSNTYFKFNLGALMRGDLASRFTAYGQALTNGFFSINDVRRLEDYPPVDGGEIYRVQMQMQDITAEPAPAPEPVAEEPEPDEEVEDEEEPERSLNVTVNSPAITLPSEAVEGAIETVTARTVTVLEGGIASALEGGLAAIATHDTERLDTFERIASSLTTAIEDLRADVRRPRVTHKQVIRGSDGRIIEVREVAAIEEAS